MTSSKDTSKYESIDASTVEACMVIYPDVLAAVYQATRPRLKLKDIINDDTWRYEELPLTLANAEYLSKDQLARLVRWKITHGTNRPFLPGMIQKNTDVEVKERSSEAASLIAGISRDQSTQAISSAIDAALTAICKLKGVGPATGTLVLSVFQPEIVPFFEDELFYWTQPEHDAKLKYDKKEYKLLLEEVLNVVLSTNIEARQIEKSAYVLMHSDKFNDAQREKLNSASRATRGSAYEGDSGDTNEEPGRGSARSAEPVVSSDTNSRATKRDIESPENANASIRRSKRTKTTE